MQETKLPENGKLELSGFDSFLKNAPLGPNEIAHGGVAILASKKCSKYEIKLNTNLQAVAISIKLQKRITVCSLYCPPIAITPVSFKSDLQNLVDQLPKPFLLLGDFNAHNPLWFGQRTDARGTAVESILLENDVYFLDQNKDTHYYHDQAVLKSSHIDLSLCSTNLLLDFEWGMYHSLMDSDHLPIWLRSGRKSRPVSFPKWVINKADWPKFTEKAIPVMAVNDFDSTTEASNYCKNFITDAAKESIPKTSGNETEYKNIWWNKDCEKAKQNRKVAWENHVEGIGSKAEWQRCRAKARQLFNWNKKKCWIKFMESIDDKASSKDVWRKIGILTKKYKSKAVTTLKMGNEVIDDPKEIADKIGETLAEISSEANCSPEFLRFKAQNERRVNFSTRNVYSYNSSISRNEMEAALSDSGDTAPGPDEIHNKMLKNLSEESKVFLLDLLNYIFSEGTLPEDWKLAYVIPILKKDKDPLDPKSYRPISLTSCICKLFERILSRRLVWFLKNNDCLHMLQSGFQKGKSTLDPLTSVVTEIHDAFVQNKLLISIFFDLKNAYDKCWPQLILMELHNLGLRGKLPIIISDYLLNRRFQVRVGNKLSKVFKQEMGVPQGGILSVHLFLVAMNTVVNFINSKLTFAIYVDDLRVSYLASTLRSAQRVLTMLLNQLQIWMNQTGFKFSGTKTKAVIFRRGPRWVNLRNEDLKLKIGDEDIETVTVIKVLGLLLDEKLTWVPQIDVLKQKCLKSLNAMKLMVRYSKCGDPNFLLRIYRALIRSKLDYGCQAYGTAGKSHLEKLDPVHHAALRLCIGAYRTTNNEALYVEANEMSLTNRRLFLDLVYFFRAQRIPVDDKVLPWEDTTLDPIYERKSNVYFKPESFGFKTRKLIKDLEIRKPIITEIRIYKNPPWNFDKVEVCFYLAKLPKTNTTDELFRQEFLKHKHKTDLEIFTDGSKCLEKVGSGVVIRRGDFLKEIPLRLQDNSSVFIAELFAIRVAIFELKNLQNLTVCIYSDSRSALQAIDKFYSEHPLVQTIQEEIAKCSSAGLVVKLCWVPGHVGIEGNDLADKVAKAAVLLETITFKEISARDFKLVLKDCIIGKWQSEWDILVNSNRTALTKIQHLVNQNVKVKGLSRLEAIKFTRLRLGYAKFVTQYLVKKEDPPYCISCAQPITVKHVLLECGDYLPQRIRFFWK